MNGGPVDVLSLLGSSRDFTLDFDGQRSGLSNVLFDLKWFSIPPVVEMGMPVDVLEWAGSNLSDGDGGEHQRTERVTHFGSESLRKTIRLRVGRG